MTILQLFKIIPSRQFTLELLQLYGINDFVATLETFKTEKMG